MGDEPPSLTVGTGVSAKYKGAFCEAKIRKVVRSVKCKVLFKNGLGSYTISDDQIRGTIRIGSVVELRHPEKKELSEATITKIQDCSQYTVVFDDGDITTLRRTALCLKSGKHFAESETLDQLPLTHPEHFSTPVIGGRRGRRTRVGASEASSDEDGSFHESNDLSNFKETDIGRVVCVEGAEKRKNRDNWFPALIVAPTAQESVAIRVREEYLVRSFKDGRYYTVPKKEILEFSPEMGSKAETNSLKTAVEKAIQFIDHDELPLHWDRDLLLYGVTDGGSESDGGDDNEGSDDEPREKKDHFVAQLYKFMDENGTPINEEPVIGCKDVDLFRLYKVVNNLAGYNRVSNQNNWKNVSVKLGFGPNPVIVGMVKQCYKKYLLSFEACPKRSGYAMQPRLSRSRNRVGRASVVSDRSISNVSVKFEKEKSAEKVVEKVAEALAPKESVATGSKPVPLTPQKEIVPVLAKTPVLAKPLVVAKAPLITKPQILTKPPVLVPIKEKGPNKKATPIPTSSLVPKPVNDPKTSTKEATGLKLRNLKLTKNIEVPPIALKQEPKVEGKTETAEAKEVTSPPTKDKKKRVIARIDRKDIPLIRGGKVDCLANTRQKRVIKERLKTVAESIKARTKTTALSIDGIEKSVVVKSKGKEEVGVTAKGNKKEENAAVALINDEKRKGRKRKEKSEVFDEHYDVLPTYKSISLGDKLKVYYGPTKEAKITSYEAKVLNIKEENSETLYLVHYTGWNTRYDEWIRANRIADNLSWVAGRASKKQAQASTPKHPKKEKKTSKNDAKGSRDSSNSGPSSGNNALNAKETHQTRQGSVGRSTTPCSIASSSSRSRGIVMKRPSTRAAQFKKDDDLEESESDGASDTDDSKAPISSHSFNVVESSSAFSGKNKKAETVSKSEDSDSSIVAVKMETEDNEAIEDETQLVISGVVSLGCVSESKEEENEPAEVKAEAEEYNKEEDDEEEEYDDENLNEDSVDERKDEKDVYGIFIEEEIKEESNDSGTVDVPLLGFDTPNTSGDNNVSVPSPANSVPSRKSSIHGSDSLPDNENGVGEEPIDIKTEEDLVVEDVEMKSEPEEITNTDEGEPLEVETMVIPMEAEPEDVYEFKEPEPFEFEARKSSDDRVKASKRNISIVLEDPPPSPKFKSSPVQNVVRESSPQLTLPDLAKDDTSPESTPTIQTCEEAFDKICASPLRAATLESHHIALLDHMESYEDDDNFDDDSEDRLVISERESDNCSTGSFEKDKESNTSGHARAAPEIIELKSTEQTNFDCKEDFTKDEDDDDEDAEDFEDEAINNAIQTAMNMETSDESSNEEIIPNEEGATSVTEIEVQKTEEVENTSELVDVGNSDINTGKEVEDCDQTENADQVELPVADDKDASEEETKEENEVIVSSDSVVVDNSGDVAPENKEVEVGEEVEMDTADPEEDENNIESLICEETIPGSPPSQLEVLNQIEDKHMMGEDDIFKTECEIPVTTASAETGDAKHLAQAARSPSISPGSEESSTPSPTRESDNATVSTNDKKQEKDYERNENRNVETTTFKKDCGKSSTSSTETRAKKAEVKTPAKRGRKSKKKNEEGPARKKYARHGKHQGSESDENYEWASGVNKTEASQSRSLHYFRQTFIIAADKLSSMDPAQRINQIGEAMQNLRTMYNNIKSELATIDKRRKRIKRREREDAARNNSARSH